jgi:hypothetical protein
VIEVTGPGSADIYVVAFIDSSRLAGWQSLLTLNAPSCARTRDLRSRPVPMPMSPPTVVDVLFDHPRRVTTRAASPPAPRTYDVEGDSVSSRCSTPLSPREGLPVQGILFDALRRIDALRSGTWNAPSSWAHRRADPCRHTGEAAPAAEPLLRKRATRRPPLISSGYRRTVHDGAGVSVDLK